MSAVQKRAETKQAIATEILTDLDLMNQWSAFGDPYLVGATALDLIVAPDIDMEIYCDRLTIDDGFSVLQTCAKNPNVVSAEFKNCLYSPDQGLYWKLTYTDEEGDLWKIDMWSVRKNHPGPLGKDFIEPMKKALNDQDRETILKLKEGVLIDPNIHCRSIHIYQAVLQDRIDSIQGLAEWLQGRDTEELIDWKPGGIRE